MSIPGHLEYAYTSFEVGYNFSTLPGNPCPPNNLKFHVLMTMSKGPKIEVIVDETINNNTDTCSMTNYSSSSQSGLNKIYQLAELTKSSINSTIYAATGIKLNQKKLVISFIFTLIKDFILAYSVRASLKLIPKLLKMIQILK